MKNFISGNLPEFLIVGAQKAGTTSLFSYLNQHPNITGSIPKEVGFFSKDSNYIRGLKWYKKTFISFGNPLKKHIYFEATPEYLYYPYVAERIKSLGLDIKIIILLRDPVARAYSSWNMYRDFLESGKELPKGFYSGYLQNHDNNLYKELYTKSNFPSFEEAVEEDISKYQSGSGLLEPSFVRRGIYYPQVKRYLNYFGPDNVKILWLDDLNGKNKITELNSILTFLDLEKSNWSFLKDKKKNKRTYLELIPEKTEQRLRNFYAPHNKLLFNLIKRDLSWC